MKPPRRRAAPAAPGKKAAPLSKRAEATRARIEAAKEATRSKPAAPAAVKVEALGVKVERVRVNPATGDEPPLVAPPAVPPPPPVDEAAEREIRYCLDALDNRLATDPVLRDEVAAFRSVEWKVEARGKIYAEAGRRWCRISTIGDSQVELGTLGFNGSKRIPL